MFCMFLFSEKHVFNVFFLILKSIVYTSMYEGYPACNIGMLVVVIVLELFMSFQVSSTTHTIIS